jgi:O-acetyl-ADP-ribose deacetylase (regulator of RNase III)
MQISRFDLGGRRPDEAPRDDAAAELAVNGQGEKRGVLAIPTGRTAKLLGFPVRGSGGWRRTTPFIELTVGDITSEHSDAIVNPAGPGFVDLAIRRLAGPGLLDAFHQGTRELPGAKLLPGHAFVTPSFGLPSRNIVHCGPPIHAENPVRARLDLERCHVEALRLARVGDFSSLSFPAIATGVYRYPLAEAAEVAITTVVEELREHGSPSLVRFVLFGSDAFAAYSKVAESLLGPPLA